ncbi:hypothetical protein C8J57DRAFT_1345834 [Mycena rebaudengoi]|nr:hypothetical protein C8J57DRAFT_1345834 [Mycena rebaudengoi]
MSVSMLARVAHEKAALREGLRIVRTVIARDAKGSGPGLTTSELYKRALKEPPLPTFSETLPAEDEDASSEATKYGRTGRKRIPPPVPPHPRHPISSLSFLKHRILPHIEGEHSAARVRETRVTFHAVAPQANQRPGKRPSKAKEPEVRMVPIEKKVMLWRAQRAVPPRAKPPPPPLPNVYDCSHMKASKRKAHKARDELVVKRALLVAKREKLQAASQIEVQRERQKVLRAAARARHEAEVAAALVERERKRKVWEERERERKIKDKTKAPPAKARQAR